jgi:6-pyruvoyltetrahydropterin/6-carboxytetrahydropterin synthase
MIYLTRHDHFNAAHKLSNPKWSKEKNVEVFGKCANDNWHGHNYELIVKYICDELDHKNLNMDVAFLKDILPSTENVAIAIWQQLEPHLPKNVKLHCIKLYETPRICVEYFGSK